MRTALAGKNQHRVAVSIRCLKSDNGGSVIGATCQYILGLAAIDLVVTQSTVYGVLSVPGKNDVDPVATRHHVDAVSGIDQVVPG